MVSFHLFACGSSAISWASSLGAGISLLPPRLLSAGTPLIHIASIAARTGDFRRSTRTTTISAVGVPYLVPLGRYFLALKYFFIHSLSGWLILSMCIALSSVSGSGPPT